MRTSRPVLAALVLFNFPAACQTRPPSSERVQEALRSGAAGALTARLAVAPVTTPPPPDASDELPRASVQGAALRFERDDAHESIASLRVGSRLAVAWTNRAHDGLWFGQTDLRGVAEGSGQRIFTATEGEESAEAPSLVATASGFAVAWVDGENGRVMFRLIDAQRRAVGPAVIVHEGLDAPRSVSLAASAEGFGLVAALWQGVYFAQLDPTGARVGEGTMVSEGEPVTALHALRFERDTFTVAWTTSQNGRPARVERRLSTTRHDRGA